MVVSPETERSRLKVLTLVGEIHQGGYMTRKGKTAGPEGETQKSYPQEEYDAG